TWDVAPSNRSSRHALISPAVDSGASRNSHQKLTGRSSTNEPSRRLVDPADSIRSDRVGRFLADSKTQLPPGRLPVRRRIAARWAFSIWAPSNPHRNRSWNRLATRLLLISEPCSIGK